MSEDQDWEQRYASTDQLFEDTPSELLRSHQPLLHAGMTALAIGDGEGRNGVWLAEQGLDVLSVDISPTALARAQARAECHGVTIRTRCVDVMEWNWPENTFDLITCIFVHLPAALRSRLHESMRKALKPAGLVMIEGFDQQQLQYDSGGPRHPDLLYDEATLRQEFADCRIMLTEQRPTEVWMAGQYQGQGSVIHFIARAAGDAG